VLAATSMGGRHESQEGFRAIGISSDMRISFVLPGFSLVPIGGFKVVYQYCNQLVRRGHDVTVLHPLDLDPTLNLYRRLRRGTHRLWMSFRERRVGWCPVDPRIRMLIVSDLARGPIPDGDAIFATAWQTAEYVTQYPPSKGRKFYLVQDFGSWFGPQKRLEATWRQPFNRVVISRWLYEQVCATVGSADNTTYITNGLDHRSFRLTNEIAGRPKRIIMLYARSSYKAVEDGLRALEMVRDRHCDLEIVFFGPDFRRPGKLPSWVLYKGNIPEEELVKLYNSSRICVCSSVAEGWAAPPAEAMACGCAVATTACGGVQEFAEHEVTALLSPPRDPAALAVNVLRLLEDENLRLRLARAGYERIQGFTWERSAELLEQFISRAVLGDVNLSGTIDSR
jgi:glycosyltransferase involved in cell wall biosynthesis